MANGINLSDKSWHERKYERETSPLESASTRAVREVSQQPVERSITQLLAPTSRLHSPEVVHARDHSVQDSEE